MFPVHSHHGCAWSGVVDVAEVLARAMRLRACCVLAVENKGGTFDHNPETNYPLLLNTRTAT
jgi:hypothetical protein